MDPIHCRTTRLFVALLGFNCTCFSVSCAQDPDAATIFQRMRHAIQAADSLSYRSEFQQTQHGRDPQDAVNTTYRIWLKKPNHFRMETYPSAEAAREGRPSGVMVGDGQRLWIYWPGGRPIWKYVKETAESERTRNSSFMTRGAGPGKHSILHEAIFLSNQMGFPVVEPSWFHGYSDPMSQHLDSVSSKGQRKLGGIECEGVEVSYLAGQRIQTYWIGKSDHLPRAMSERIRVENEVMVREVWSEINVDATLDAKLFQWTPPADWKRWELPDEQDDDVAAGHPAPDFDLRSIDGSRIKLSAFRGRPVWLSFWRLGCPGCRVETPFLQRTFQQHAVSGLTVLGVNVTDPQDLTNAYLKEHGVTYPNVLDTSQTAQRVYYEDYGVGSIPMNYVVDRSGKVVDAWIGHSPSRAKRALEKVGIRLERQGADPTSDDAPE